MSERRGRVEEELLESVRAMRLRAERAEQERDRLAREAAAWKADFDAELSGALKIRQEYGARVDETFAAFVARLRQEGYDARQERDRLREELDSVRRVVQCAEGMGLPDRAVTDALGGQAEHGYHPTACALLSTLDEWRSCDEAPGLACAGHQIADAVDAWREAGRPGRMRGRVVAPAPCAECGVPRGAHDAACPAYHARRREAEAAHRQAVDAALADSVPPSPDYEERVRAWAESTRHLLEITCGDDQARDIVSAIDARVRLEGGSRE